MRAAREFEAYFLKLLLTEMRKTVGSGGLFGSPAADQYRGLVEDALAKRAAEAGSFGLARELLERWSRQNANADGGTGENGSGSR